MKQLKQHRIAIISSEFWKDIVESLEKHCILSLEKNGIQKEKIDVFRVPGSLEIPIIAKKVAQKNKYSAIIVFGVIHKGKTYHFELISNECARGCMDVSLQYEIPIIYEVLSVYNIKDAKDRAVDNNKNKGVEAAKAAIEMINLIQKI
ncbi:6,7-dimethyl-8-ribityllumazine synthase [Patescibacteria group bacterium]|nr:6,7-dimethyl-8-ribityllumazine synthase [Patescibacteria group bacterium]